MSIPKQESVKRYWSRRVILPTALGMIFLLGTMAAFVVYSIKSSERKNLETVVSTLAMFVADPILMKDGVEMIKRVSTVGSKDNLTIVVKNSKENILVSYPPDFGKEPDLHEALTHDVISNSGSVIGKIWVKTNNSNLKFDQFSLIIFGVFAFLALILVWVVLSFKPIFRDLVGLRGSSDGNLDHDRQGFIFSETQKTFDMIQEQSQKLILTERERSTAKIARQVAHDIRSPLTTLKIFSDVLLHLPELERIAVKDALSSINDIANSMLERGKNIEGALSDDGVLIETKKEKVEPLSVQLLSSLVETAVSEKRIQYKLKVGVKIEAQYPKKSYGIFSQIQPNLFKRILSNLINNAVEAIPTQGHVEVKIISEGKVVKLQIIDNGQGIPEEILPTVGEENVTYKPGGHGLGVSQAKETLKAWGGELKINSRLNHGTTVEVIMPKAEPPSWFCSQLSLNAIDTVAILDDDPSIHKVWDRQFEPFSHDTQVLHFSTVDEIMTFCDGRSVEQKVLFLCDYELLNQPLNGLEIIETLGIAKNSILVTSRYDEKEIREKCVKLGVRMIPKGLANLVPIVGDVIAMNRARAVVEAQ